MTESSPGRYMPLPTSEDVEASAEVEAEGARLKSEMVGSCDSQKPETLGDKFERLQEKGRELLEQTEVQLVSGSIIFLNSVVTGVETDNPSWPHWDLLENGFLLFFTVELIVRIIIISPTRYLSFYHPEFMWNVFDICIVGVGVIDYLMTQLVADAGSMKFATVFRIVRLCRLLRILRIFRFLRQLYLFMYGFAEAIMAIFWVTVLMTFVLYICGIVLAKLYGSVGPEDPDFHFLSTRFGTVSGSMLTLFELMSSPDLGAYHSVMHHHPSILPFLVAFIIFGSFGMIALLTGVISESMFEKNKARVEEQRLEREQRRAKFQNDCGELFDSMIEEEGGVVTPEALCKHKEAIAKLLSESGVSVTDFELDQMFDALDSDASGTVERMEFENGVIQMCEDIRPMSIMEIHHSIRKCHVLIETGQAQMQEKIDKMARAMGTLVPLDDAFAVPRSTSRGFSDMRTSSKQSVSASARSCALSVKERRASTGSMPMQGAMHAMLSFDPKAALLGAESVSPLRASPRSCASQSSACHLAPPKASPRPPPSPQQQAASSPRSLLGIAAAGPSSQASSRAVSISPRIFDTAPPKLIASPGRMKGGSPTSLEKLSSEGPDDLLTPQHKSPRHHTATFGAQRIAVTPPDAGEQRSDAGEQTPKGLPTLEGLQKPVSLLHDNEPRHYSMSDGEETARKSTTKTLQDFRRRLEELALEVGKELHAIESKAVASSEVSSVGECLALQAWDATTLDAFLIALEKVTMAGDNGATTEETSTDEATRVPTLSVALWDGRTSEDEGSVTESCSTLLE